jgi:hypothetical protein
MRPYLKKNLLQKRAGGVAQGVDPEFKPPYCKNKQIKTRCWQLRPVIPVTWQAEIGRILG